ncbi:BamA/TamA family outer membrane protein [Neolewinella antarctica]|uniref:Bacterial surface antigen (D15) domain-containing protein n=1 Tax=Neolewinella antarctica TaxID=442734 RepID=A0ABX0XBR2_9BACT|nr:BamA/TamA family outer membrane protein [Neolewinella antarctica]NJC26406.1 hypothetical protein [Neolewinella antarctica]
MTKYLSLFLFTLLPLFLPAQVRLLVAGNTADAKPEFFTALDGEIRSGSTPATVLFAGDYVPDCSDAMIGYRKEDATTTAAFASLQPLLDLIRRNPETDFYLLPGDRDWDKSGKDGLACVCALEDFLLDQNLKNLNWPLAKGCPGPEFAQLSPTVRLMMVNTQWWNHPYEKPVPSDAACNFSDPSISLDEIMSTIEENQDENIIIAGHYPPKSQGRYGGKFPARDHFIPPIIGSIRLSFRQNIGTAEELTNVRFANYADKIKDYNSQFEGLMFIGAQDKSEQLLGFGRNYILNAGAPAAGRWVAKHKPARHTSQEAGFAELFYAEDGEVTYRYVRVDGSTEATETIYHAPCSTAKDTFDVNPAFPPCELAEAAMVQYDKPVGVTTVAAAAGPQYERSGFGSFWLGAHYRDSWTTPVAYPVLDLASNPLGLEPIRQGGGRQTTSLKLRADNGEAYVFRSVDKDPSGTFNYEIRNTLVGEAIRDQTSSGYPYGGLIIAPLLDELNILHASPKPYLLAPGRTLGEYNPVFGDLLGTLEISPQGEKKKKDRPGTFGADDVLKSFELFRERYDDQEVLINHEEFLRARLFDMLVGDWSKHEDNWKWAQFDVGEEERIRPIPRDRDNAFSRMDGVFPWIASRRWAVPNLENFGYNNPDVRSLTHQARHMDRLLLSPLGRDEFRKQAALIQASLTDEVLANAVGQIPAPAPSATGAPTDNNLGADAGAKFGSEYRAQQAEILEKLKRRRDDLQAYAADYYELHAGVVDIIGTNDEEEFTIEALANGALHVTSTDLKGKSEGKILYDRTFLPTETKEVRIYGLGDDDRFVTKGPVGQKIRVRVIGGEGDDLVTSEGERPRKVLVYDKSLAPESSDDGVRYVKTWHDEAYYYNRTDFEYNTTAPVISGGYNSFNGVQLGAGILHTRRNYLRRDFSSRYRFYVEGSTVGNAALEASAEFGQVIRYADLILGTRVGRPDFYNFFFGLGNNTVKVPDVVRNDFNLVSLDHFSVEGGLRRRYAKRSYFNLMLGYQNNKITNREGTILDPEDGTRFYGDGDFVFGYVRPEFRLDLRDHAVFPSKGVMVEASHKQAFGRKNAVDFGVSKVAAEIHISTRRFPISVSFRTGYARSSGRAPFYELPSLGQRNGLRGFQRNRFVGDGYFFYNAEFRSPVALVRSRVVPFAVGIRAFYDQGRIIQRGDGSNEFKSAYGGGIYVIPASRSFTLSALLGWSEEESALIQVGLGTNF